MVRRLPVDANLRLSAHAEHEYRSGSWWKKELDERMGRGPVHRTRMSLDEAKRQGL